MNEAEWVKLLSRVDIFDALSKRELEDLSGDLLRQNAVIHLREGETFYTPEQHHSTLFVLVEGRVRIYKMEGARESTLEVVHAGAVFGEVAFTSRRLRDAYAEATEPSSVVAMDRADAERLILRKPQVGIRMIGLLSERLHYYETRIEDAALKDVPARLASLVLFLVEREGVRAPGEIRIPTHYTHEHLGTMIGANREAVTRAFGRLQDEGAVQIRRRLIHVSDLEAVEGAAGRHLEGGAPLSPP